MRSVTVGAAAVLLAVGWALMTNWDPISRGHPSYLIFYFVAGLLGTYLLMKSLRTAPPASGRWKQFAATLALVLLAGFCLWISPFGADPVALAVLDSPVGLNVTESPTEITLSKPGEKASTGLVFYPGARVDARAYLAILRPLADSGTQVVVVKEPLGVAFFSGGFVSKWIAENPDIGTWIVGGHSLGGVVAASAAVNSGVDGLLLWASFPASDIASAELEVTSIYGTADAIALPEDIIGSAERLPQTSRLVPIEGAIHSFFGDYGTQPGDGEAQVDRGTAQAQIIDESQVLINAVQG